MRGRLLTVAAVCLTSLAASAQIPKANVFLGYSYMSADTNSNSRPNLNGWNGSLEGKFLPWVGIVADLNGQYGSQSVTIGSTTVKPSQHYLNVLFGPQVSVSVGKITPFAHILGGVSHINVGSTAFTSSTSDTSFGDAIGGGVDYKLIPGLGWRLQADLVQTRFFSTKQNDFRLATGVVFHF
jgi:opacity protein-like surface antigen